MSKWTHAICPADYDAIYPGRMPTRVIGDYNPCCKCGEDNDGIYWRADPTTLPCGGEHEWDDDE